MIKPQLAAHGVNLVAVGLEQLGVEEFLERKFLMEVRRLEHCYGVNKQHVIAKFSVITCIMYFLILYRSLY